MLQKNILKNLKTKSEIMICGIGLHYFIAEIKTKIDVFPRSRFIFNGSIDHHSFEINGVLDHLCVHIC